MRKDAEPIRPERKRIAIPLPEGIVDPEAVTAALKRFAEAVRENKFRPRTDQDPSRLHWNELVDSAV